MQDQEKLFEMWRVYYGDGEKMWRVVKYNGEGVITMHRTFHKKKAAKNYMKELMSRDW